MSSDSSASKGFSFQAPTTSVDPFIMDDELIPYNAFCCTVNSLFLRTPDCYGGHGVSALLCCNQEFACCKPGRNPDEYCIVNDSLASCIKPNIVCKGGQQVFCFDARHVFLDLKTMSFLDPDFPCLVNIFGLTLCYNYMWTPMCCKPWKEIKVATGTEIMKKPARPDNQEPLNPAPAPTA